MEFQRHFTVQLTSLTSEQSRHVETADIGRYHDVQKTRLQTSCPHTEKLQIPADDAEVFTDYVWNASCPMAKFIDADSPL